MFIVTAKIPRRRRLLLAAFVLVAAAAALFLLRGGKPGAGGAQAAARADTNEARMAYLTALGWEVDETPIEALRLTLPEELVEPYRSYNALQLEQGFDLTPLLGETLERYTYAVRNYPGHADGCQADLYVYDGAVVAGDVLCTGADGFIAALDFPSGK